MKERPRARPDASARAQTPARRTDAKSSPQEKASKTEVARVDPGGATAPEDATHRWRKRRRPTRRLPRSIEAAEDEVESDEKHHPRRKQARRTRRSRRAEAH